MLQESNRALKDLSPYNAAITREQFMFFDMRTTAKLLCSGLDRSAVVERIVAENLFQYPTEKSIRRMAVACIKRLDAMDDDSLITAIANRPSSVSKQICLYAMMCQQRLVSDFMLTVIGEKYRTLDSSFGRIDINSFFLRLQAQDAWVATWSDSTIAKISQVLLKLLVDNEYLDSTTANRLNPVLLDPLLENAIRESGRGFMLPAFNYFL